MKKVLKRKNRSSKEISRNKGDAGIPDSGDDAPEEQTFSTTKKNALGRLKRIMEQAKENKVSMKKKKTDIQNRNIMQKKMKEAFYGKQKLETTHSDSEESISNRSLEDNYSDDERENVSKEEEDDLGLSFMKPAAIESPPVEKSDFEMDFIPFEPGTVNYVHIPSHRGASEDLRVSSGHTAQDFRIKMLGRLNKKRVDGKTLLAQRRKAAVRRFL